ncbi:hypothetical protein JY96_21205 [Aquabacterium sp. NJ1]|uniref:hypothetical protein n=1 Tax=Aquabacterium sp. NJ1 TaxID=1538295 RepID=UPI00052C077F|nr:hypothetical protein [Aquabacterium sp. NJ1]KGM38696.1 hypothetical protein JY96_21205 [Aquabacterium sp. NJ1]
MKQQHPTVWVEIRKAAAEAPAMYFAPLIGALRGIRAQYDALDRRQRHQRQTQSGKQPVRG